MEQRNRLSPLQLHRKRVANMPDEERPEEQVPEDVTAFTFNGHVIKVRV